MGPHARTRHGQNMLRHKRFADAALDFLGGKVRKNGNRFRDSVTANFHAASATDLRVAALAEYSIFNVRILPCAQCVTVVAWRSR
jgi:hypothetical protein